MPKETGKGYKIERIDANNKVLKTHERQTFSGALNMAQDLVQGEKKEHKGLKVDQRQFGYGSGNERILFNLEKKGKDLGAVRLRPIE